MAVFSQNVSKNTHTHRNDNNHNVHVLVTKQKKKIWKMSTGYSKMSFTKNLVKPLFLGFLT